MWKPPLGASCTSLPLLPLVGPQAARRLAPLCPPRAYGSLSDEAANAHLPPWPTTPHPTPYEILHLGRSDAYSKRRFYQLAKLYHPDTSFDDSHRPALGGLSRAARLERYRLVVAAHDLLSDPHRRRLYDCHGLGWPRGPLERRHKDDDWHRHPGSPARNATWEDWERWREARDGRRPEPVYMSNGIFATLVVAACLAATAAQLHRAESSAARTVDAAHRQHQTIGQEMARNSFIAVGRTRDQRLDNFLRERELSLGRDQALPADNLPDRRRSPP